MTQAAILIQSKFRSYYEQKKFQQSRRAAVLIQQYYRSYKEYERLKQGHRASAAMQQKLKYVHSGAPWIVPEAAGSSPRGSCSLPQEGLPL